MPDRSCDYIVAGAGSAGCVLRMPLKADRTWPKIPGIRFPPSWLACAAVSGFKRVIADDRYPLSRRIRTLQGILDKLMPPPVRAPLPLLKVYAPPRAKPSQRRGRR